MPSKQEKFAEVETFRNCFAFFFDKISEGFPLKGRWHRQYFENNNPIVLELGCGKGEYTIGLAGRHPEKNFIGVDIKGNRIWSGAKTAIDRGLPNVAFLRTRIDFIDHGFAKDEVSEIWITFPDPQPQSTRARKRLTHPIFINRYKTFLRPGGLVHLKTDSTSLYEYTMGMIEENRFRVIYQTNDLYNNCPPGREELVQIKTYYEALFSARGENIKYVCFQIN